MDRPDIGLLIPLALLTLTACAAEGGREGGADRLPDRGITGWERSASDPTAPYVLTAPDALLASPSAIVVGGRVIVYGHRALGDGTFRLFRADGDATGSRFDAPVDLALTGRDPSVARVDGTTWLAYVDAEGRVAIAKGSDGVSFTPLGVQGVNSDRSAPSLIIEADRARLYLATGTAIVHTEAALGTVLVFGPEVLVLAPGVDCRDRNGEAEACWDEDAIVEAEVRRASTPVNTIVYRMFYTAHAGGDSDVGFAASFDGLDFTRFAYNPVLTGTFDERSPTSVLAADTYVLFWDEARSTTDGGLVRASHAPTAAADRW